MGLQYHNFKKQWSGDDFIIDLGGKLLCLLYGDILAGLPAWKDIFKNEFNI